MRIEDIMAIRIQTFNGTGSDCSGNSGDSNRVLTLSNTKLTIQNGLLVYASGLALALITEYTVSHLSASTTITFLNPLWDDMTVVVRYYETVDPTLATDFIRGPLNDFGVEVVRTPVTVTTDFHGDKTYTDGTDETIEVVFENPNKKFTLDKAGLTEVYDAKMYTKQDQTITKYDKITYDSKVYRVDTVSIRNFNGTAMFKTVTLFFIKNE